MTSTESKYLVVVAVLPEYRYHFVRRLHELLPGDVLFAAGDEHLIGTVQSGDSAGLKFIRLRNIPLFKRRLLWQAGALKLSRNSESIVVDLNPRSLTAWLILIRGRLLGQRVLVWGHILPRAGANATTVPLRRFMRRLANGVISYTWSDSEIVRREDPDVPVWVAANGLYPRSRLGASDSLARDQYLFVGRLVPDKKPDLAIRAIACLATNPASSVRLTIAGSGPELPRLQQLAATLGVEERISFLGHVSDTETLRTEYGRSIASLSPGYAGLSLTQSLGFGVPMLIARDEPHAPEIELFDEGAGFYFRSDDPESLADAMTAIRERMERGDVRRDELVARVERKYSSDAMAEGFRDALIGAAE